jgi:hypothetical protein
MAAARASSTAAPGDAFRVPGWLDALGGLASRHPRAMARLGRLESRVLADEIEGLAIDRPIYVAGLARSGSTILLETLARHPATASHAYRDFPLVATPFFWNWFLDRVDTGGGEAVERAHGDGMQVTPASPEAMEEMLWMAFFPHLHGGAESDVLGPDTDAPGFEAFYRAHLRKLLWLRGGSRYLAKGNYNVTRLEYLLALMPDARFVVPVRDPADHAASLARQHERFCERHRRDPRALRYMQRVGHFEFGLDRRPINVDPAATAAILEAWHAGRDTEGWARLWAAVYGHVAERLAASPALSAATIVVRHEDLCADPRRVLAEVFAHCRLADADGLIAEAARIIAAPPSPPGGGGEGERQAIADHAGAVAARFGYG